MLGAEYRGRAENAHRWYASEVTRLVEAFPGTSYNLIGLQMCHCVPWLFADAFPELSEEDRCRVAAAGLLYSSHILALDRVVDGDVPASGTDLLFGALMHERALTMLFPRLPADTDAWTMLGQYVRQYVQALGIEGHHRGHIRPFPLELAERVGAGKGAVLKASPMIMAYMADRGERIDALDAAIDPFNAAVQIRDDLEDWSEDYRAERYSYVLTKALTTSGLDAAIASGVRPASEDVGHALFYSTVATDALEHAIQCCDGAAGHASTAGFGEWNKYLQLAKAHLETIARECARLRERGLATARHASDVDAPEKALSGLIDGLTREHAAGYPEAQHRMSFPRSQGFNGDSDFHSGDVFARATFGWLYQELLAAGQPIAEDLVRENLDRLAALRVKGQRGGWSYFPTVSALPPDTDDLAQVIHAAFLPSTGANGLRHSRTALERGIEESVELVLDSCVHVDGSVDTWIVDPDCGAEASGRYRFAIDNFWGRGVDPEVVANFCAALIRWSPARYARQVRQGAKYVASCQRSDGAWDSTWYVGPYYGTFVCTRLLRLANAQVDARRRAEEFLARSQHRDGGWGIGSESDALSTALALLAWARGDHLPEGSDDRKRAAIERARRYLLVAQREDGFWPASPFIVMNMNRPDPNAPPRLVTYQSSTMTAAFAGVALLATAPTDLTSNRLRLAR